jgi:hypothetical protein
MKSELRMTKYAQLTADSPGYILPDILYFPELDQLFISTFPGTIWFDKKTFNKYGQKRLLNMDFYIIGQL